MKCFQISLVASLFVVMLGLCSPSVNAQGNPPVRETIYSIVNTFSQDYLIAYHTDEVGKATPYIVASLSGVLTDSSLTERDYVRSIDFRPGTNRLYALTNQHRLFDINTATGAITLVGTLDIADPFGTSADYYDIDFDPTDGSLRVLISAGLSSSSETATTNYRVNPDTAAVIATDKPLTYAPGQPKAGQSVYSRFAAYTPLADGRTTLYGFSYTINSELYTIGSTSGSPLPPASGQVFNVAQVYTNLCGPFVGFDISQSTGKAYLVQSCQSPGTKAIGLFEVNLQTGASTPLGEINTGSQNTSPGYARELGLIAVGPDFQPGAARLQFQVSSTLGLAQKATEQANGQVSVTVLRLGNSAGSVSVNYTTNANPPAGDDGTLPAATPGEDFTPVSGTLVFPDGVVASGFTVPILNDSTREPLEAAYFSLSNPTGGATVVAPATTRVIIYDDDVVKFGFEGASGNYKEQIFFENYGEAVVAVEIRSEETLPVNINYATAPASFKAATPGEDYTPVSGTLMFAPGERLKNIRIPLVNDDIVEGGETFKLTITDPLTGNSVRYDIHIRNYREDLANLVLRQYVEGGREMLEIISTTDDNFRSESANGVIGGTLILPSVRVDRTAVRFQLPQHVFFRGESIFVTGMPIPAP